MSKIKICGLTKLQDIYFVNEAMPDYVGFVFAKSKRQISFEQAFLLKSSLSKEIKSVGVFVNEDINFIKKLCQENIIDIIQLHGDEDFSYIDLLKNTVTNEIIKVIKVEKKESIVSTTCDYILFDTYNKEQHGGTGKQFDWEVIKDFKDPFFLAGGLDFHNVKIAIETLHPFCVDISSGVETNGIKDKEKILNIVNLVRSINDYE